MMKTTALEQTHTNVTLKLYGLYVRVFSLFFTISVGTLRHTHVRHDETSQKDNRSTK